jgi:hypothetical protein
MKVDRRGRYHITANEDYVIHQFDLVEKLVTSLGVIAEQGLSSAIANENACN